MKLSIAFLLLALCISGTLSAQTYGLDNADPALFTKFRVPETSLNALSLGSSLSFYSGKYSSSNVGASNSLSYSRSFSSWLEPGYFFLKESDNMYLSVSANLSGNYANYYWQGEGPGDPPNNYNKNYSDGFNLGAGETYRNYAAGGEEFCSVGSNIQLNINESYNDNRASDTTRYKIYSATKHQNYVISLGFGWGKMRNVTSVVSAIRFQEILKQLNLLNHDLSENTIEDLAQQFYRQGYYSDVHVRPDKYFWGDVQTTLAKDGVSLKGLNQYADSYIREVPGELRFMRNEGLVGGLNVQMNYLNNYYSQNPVPNRIAEQFFALGNVYVNLSHQLDLNSQYYLNASLSGGPNLVKDSPVKQQYEVTASIGYAYELTDRLVVSANEGFDVLFANASAQRKTLTDNLNVAANYFVEDNISLSGSYSWNYVDNKNLNYVGYDGTQNNNSVQVGVTYYIQRGFLYK